MITTLRLMACPKNGLCDRAVRTVGDAQDLPTPTHNPGYWPDPAYQRQQRPQRS